GRRPGTHGRLLQRAFGLDVADAGGGLRAARTAAVRPLLRLSTSDGPSLGTELLLLAAHNGLRIAQVPVTGAVAGVRLGERLVGLARVAHAMATGRADLGAPGARPARLAPAVTLLRFGLFGVVGLMSGLLYVALYLGLRTVVPPALANLAALVLGAVANTEVNRRWTFAGRRVAPVGTHLRSGVLFALHYLVMTGAVTAAVHLNPSAGRLGEVAVLLASSLAVSVLRFVGLDRWVFRTGGTRRRKASSAE
ncbi:GtrA family protein, partial [Saccharothrix hoggarensis]